MEKFDIQSFNKNKVDGHFDFVLEDGTEVRQWESPPKYFVERRRKAKSRIEHYREFHYSNQRLKTDGEEFYGFPVGTWREFDENGTLTSEVNEDLPFKFSIQDLDKKLREQKINIMEPPDGFTISRNSDPEPVYVITYPVEGSNLSQFTVWIIDGSNGKTISTSVKNRKENH